MFMGHDSSSHWIEDLGQIQFAIRVQTKASVLCTHVREQLCVCVCVVGSFSANNRKGIVVVELVVYVT